MARLRIPERSKQGFKDFIEFGDDLQQKLIQELDNVPIGLSSEKTAERLSQSLGVEIEKVHEIVDLIGSLFLNKEKAKVDLDTFVEDVCEALEQENFKLKKTFKERLKSLLSLESHFYMTFKARRLAYEREKLLLDTRILTDARPVFSENNSSKVDGFILIHNLKIEYYEGEDHKELYLAPDNSDLEKLKWQIKRAEDKEKAVKEQFSQINLSILDLE
ncbi:hypothetical protein GWO43_27110 [candidate division KSB1 bacterium]|nr:hypothetical protein [candidate division KSB1 bacterium]NIR70323.1 hypothetical protein [candidate division KSB1 bacterium]NIS27627.1 hypothetical protein [candidate division KSB1 bacterium]NIT74467.1 hypothetical protein [candidate division KSB1 bacterium]NIU28992.1 hypothetical protein [candidate division KSB1 bacterium]